MRPLRTSVSPSFFSALAIVTAAAVLLEEEEEDRHLEKKEKEEECRLVITSASRKQDKAENEALRPCPYCMASAHTVISIVPASYI